MITYGGGTIGWPGIIEDMDRPKVDFRGSISGLGVIWIAGNGQRDISVLIGGYQSLPQSTNSPHGNVPLLEAWLEDVRSRSAKARDYSALEGDVHVVRRAPGPRMAAWRGLGKTQGTTS